MLGDHAVLSDGYSTITDGLATYSDVQLQREVLRIEHDARGVRGLPS